MYMCMSSLSSLFWLQVTRDVPGIDAAYLAIDTDDGVEVVWNEVRYSNRKIRGSKVSGALLSPS